MAGSLLIATFGCDTLLIRSTVLVISSVQCTAVTFSCSLKLVLWLICKPTRSSNIKWLIDTRSIFGRDHCTGIRKKRWSGRNQVKAQVYWLTSLYTVSNFLYKRITDHVYWCSNWSIGPACKISSTSVLLENSSKLSHNKKLEFVRN